MISRSWFQTFCVFTPILGDMISTKYFSNLRGGLTTAQIILRWKCIKDETLQINTANTVVVNYGQPIMGFVYQTGFCTSKKQG